MTDSTCAVKGCDRPPHNTRGWCNAHYQRWRKYGDVRANQPIQARHPGAVCSVDDCATPAVARGWCSRHWSRWRSSGDPLTTSVIIGDDDTRFWSKVDASPTGCWVWRGTIDKYTGYGTFSVYEPGGKKRTVRSHRMVYELVKGSIPDGLALDHTCHTRDTTCPGGLICEHRRCVNPEHLEPVTSGVNVLRGLGPCAQNARKTHCKRGHEFTPENTAWIKGGAARSCRTCKRAYERAHPRQR